MPGHGGRRHDNPLRAAQAHSHAGAAGTRGRRTGRQWIEDAADAGRAGRLRAPLGGGATGTGDGGTLAAAVPRPTNAGGAEAYSAMSAAGLLSGLAMLAGA